MFVQSWLNAGVCIEMAYFLVVHFAVFEELCSFQYIFFFCRTLIYTFKKVNNVFFLLQNFDLFFQKGKSNKYRMPEDRTSVISYLEFITEILYMMPGVSRVSKYLSYCGIL